LLGKLPRHAGDRSDTPDAPSEGVGTFHNVESQKPPPLDSRGFVAAENDAGVAPAQRRSGDDRHVELPIAPGATGARFGARAVAGAATDISTTAPTPSASSASCSSHAPATARSRDDAASPDGARLQEALDAMWRYDLGRAESLLEKRRHTSAWYAAAFAECSMLRTSVTGLHDDATFGLECVRTAETLLASSSHGDTRGERGVGHQVISAELLLFRAAFNVMLGNRLRALYFARQCWQIFRRLEACMCDTAADLVAEGSRHEHGTQGTEELRGRIGFGLGFFYLATSLLPSGLGTLLRLAGFVVDRERGKAFLARVSEEGPCERAIPAAIALAMYHLDIEPDMPRAGELLVASLNRKPENMLLHWAGSVFAWRNACLSQAVEMAGKALWCCGAQLSDRALFLRYELGVLHLITLEANLSLPHLRFVYDTVSTKRVCFPYKATVILQLAAASFRAGHDDEGLAWCKEAEGCSDWKLKLERDGLQLLQIFRTHRSSCRGLLAFEATYFLRQYSKVHKDMLLRIRDNLRETASSFVGQVKGMLSQGKPMTAAHLNAANLEVVVESVSAWLIDAVLCFYMASPGDAMDFVPSFAHLCMLLPPWAAYLSAHGLYWCGRIYAIEHQNHSAAMCLRQAKAYKKHPFFIGEKISSVLASLSAANGDSAL